MKHTFIWYIAVRMLLHWGASPPKKCTLKMDFFQNRSALPPRILELFVQFSRSPIFVELFRHFFVSLFTKYLVKSAQKLLDLVTPPPFLPKITKLLVHKKFPKACGLPQNPPLTVIC